MLFHNIVWWLVWDYISEEKKLESRTKNNMKYKYISLKMKKIKGKS